MCGRYVLKASPAELQKVFHLEHVPEALPPRFNIAPLQAAPIILDASPKELTVGNRCTGRCLRSACAPA
jgi:putative SOS response-associated peptidase YedK